MPERLKRKDMNVNLPQPHKNYRSVVSHRHKFYSDSFNDLVTIEISGLIISND